MLKGRKKTHVIVVGAGVGGLCSAVALRAKGYDVTLLERAAAVGGKMRQVNVGERAFDGGPTVMTMRWVFDALFERADARIEDYLTLRQSHVIARHAWSDGTSLDLFADQARSAAAIEVFSDARNARGYVDFCNYAQRIFDEVDEPFMRAARPTPWRMLRDHGVRRMLRFRHIDAFRSMWQALGDFFTDPRLRQLFGRYATYTGSSPFDAPATLNVITHVEHAGLWLVEGGMYGLARGLETLAKDLGVRVHCQTEVRELIVSHRRVRGVILGDGTRLLSDAVVFNGDVRALSQGFLGDAARRAFKTPKRHTRSLSAMTWHMLADASEFELLHHNVFFDRNDYAHEFEDIFQHHRLPRHPTVYVCAQDRGLSAPLNTEGERIMCLVNAPASGDRRVFSKTEIDACETRMFTLLQQCGLTLTPTPTPMLRTTPNDFERLFPATGGALYGSASHGWQSSLTRPGARTPLSRLFLAGGSVHPGAGVPMAALSGQTAADCLAEDLPLTRRSFLAATSGGTSTWSAMTDSSA